MPIDHDAMRALLESVILDRLARGPASRSDLENHLSRGMRRLLEFQLAGIHKGLGRMEAAGLIVLDPKREFYRLTAEGEKRRAAFSQSREASLKKFLDLGKWREFRPQAGSNLN